MKNKDTSSEEIIEKRYRHFMILLYPEWKEYKEIMQDLKGSFKNYAYINHMPSDNEKKLHTHFLLSLDNPRTIESLSNRIGVKPNLIQNVKSLRGSCRYLIHLDNEEKEQYELANVKVSKSFANTFFKSFDDLLSDEEILQNIYDFIIDNKDLDKLELEIKLSLFVSHNAYDRVYKRFYNTISKVVNMI